MHKMILKKNIVVPVLPGSCLFSGARLLGLGLLVVLFSIAWGFAAAAGPRALAIQEPDPYLSSPLLDLEGPLTPEDIAQYRRVFEWQKKGNWKQAALEAKKIDNSVLESWVVFQKLFHPTRYRASYSELQKWLQEWAQHPASRDVYALALKRRATRQAYPRRPVPFTLPVASSGRRFLGQTLGQTTAPIRQESSGHSALEALGRPAGGPAGSSAGFVGPGLALNPAEPSIYTDRWFVAGQQAYISTPSSRMQSLPPPVPIPVSIPAAIPGAIPAASPENPSDSRRVPLAAVQTTRDKADGSSTRSTGPDTSSQELDTRVLVCYFPEIRPLPALSRAGAREVRAIRNLIRRERPTQALRRVEKKQVYKNDPVAKAQALFHITKGYVLNLKDAEALKTYRIARDEKLLEHYPATHWWAGLAAYRQGDYRQSETLFKEAAYDKGVAPVFRAGAAYWAARSAYENGRKQIGQDYLRHAMQHGLHFYALLSRRELESELDLGGALASPTSSTSTLSSTSAMSATSAASTGTPPLVAVSSLQPSSSSSSLRYATMRAAPRRVLTWRDIHHASGKRALGLAQAGLKNWALVEINRFIHDVPAPEQFYWLGVLQHMGYYRHSIYLAEKIARDYPCYDLAILFPDPGWSATSDYQVDKPVLLSLIRQESLFSARARSRAGARGLMQIMPATARFLEGNGFALEKLFQPDFNLQLGQNYLLFLQKEPYIGNNMAFLLAAYNWGPGNLRRWMKKNDDVSDELLFMETLPVEETRDYLRNIFRNYLIYNEREKNERAAYFRARSLAASEATGSTAETPPPPRSRHTAILAASPDRIEPGLELRFLDADLRNNRPADPDTAKPVYRKRIGR